jgi:hypothetical protein
MPHARSAEPAEAHAPCPMPYTPCPCNVTKLIFFLSYWAAIAYDPTVEQNKGSTHFLKKQRQEPETF